MTLFMLDTNTVSLLLREHVVVLERIMAVPMAQLCISAITEGELLFGLAKRPEAKRLQRVVTEFLQRVDVLPWDRTAAAAYGTLRATLERQGQGLAPLDMLIAGHALSQSATLVTNDRALAKVPGLPAEDWTLARH